MSSAAHHSSHHKAKRGAAPPPRDGKRVPERAVVQHAEHTVVADLEDDATQGEWLFKQNDMVLGPVTAIVLVERINAGDLDPDTPIARDGQPFKPMKLVALFRDAWESKEAERRHAADERAYQQAVKRASVLAAVVVLLMFLVPALLAAAASRALMVARPWDSSADWLMRTPPVVDLPAPPIEVKPPPVVAAAEPAPAPEPADSPDRRGDRSPGRVVKRDKKDDVKVASKNNDTGAATAPENTKSEPAKEPVKDPSPANLPETLTNAQAIAPLKEAQGDLKACFKAEIESNPDMPAQVVLSYTVNEDGRAANVALDARELRGRPVVACVQKALSALRWPRFTGERKNVSVPFKLGKPPAPKR